jgi:hypothetical protein
MASADVRLTRFVEADREPLRAACAQDREVWSIYPYSMIDAHFDPGLDGRLAKPDWIVFTIRRAETVIGTSSYIAVDPGNRSLRSAAPIICRGSGAAGSMPW